MRYKNWYQLWCNVKIYIRSIRFYTIKVLRKKNNCFQNFVPFQPARCIKYLWYLKILYANRFKNINSSSVNIWRMFTILCITMRHQIRGKFYRPDYEIKVNLIVPATSVIPFSSVDHNSRWRAIRFVSYWLHPTSEAGENRGARTRMAAIR